MMWDITRGLHPGEAGHIASDLVSPLTRMVLRTNRKSTDMGDFELYGKAQGKGVYIVIIRPFSDNTTLPRAHGCINT